MFGLFKKKKKKPLQLEDLHGNPLKVGDYVMSLRYDLGESIIIEEEGLFHYQSLKSGKKIPWVQMIDAVTEKQKVEKISNPS